MPLTFLYESHEGQFNLLLLLEGNLLEGKGGCLWMIKVGAFFKEFNLRNVNKKIFS